MSAETATIVMNTAIEASGFAESGAPLLPQAVRSELTEALRDGMKDLIFRRVARVNAKDRDLFEVAYHTDTDGRSATCKVIDPRDFRERDYTNDEHDRNLEFKYRKFFAFTAERTLRDNDKYDGQTIFLASNKYSQLDFTEDCTLKFSKKRNMRTNTVPPRPGDLVCMVVSPPTHKRKNLEASFWFTCSEQFMRAWTLLMYDEHPSFEAKGEEPRMRERYMSGNRLNTNSFLKYVLAHRQTRAALDREEAQSRYYRMRTEYVSKRWCHVYSAMVLLGRYGEMPTYQNVPGNRGDGPSCIRWDLPDRFVELLLGKYTSYDPEVHNMGWRGVSELSRQGPPRELKKPKAQKARGRSRDRPQPTGFDISQIYFPSLPPSSGRAKTEDAPLPAKVAAWAAVAARTAEDEVTDLREVKPKTESKEESKAESKEEAEPASAKTFTFNWKPLPPGTSWADYDDLPFDELWADMMEVEDKKRRQGWADMSEDMDKLSRRSEDLHVDGEY